MRAAPADHVDGAVVGLHTIDVLGPAEYAIRGPIMASVAQAHATLALVEEQRTANLLALLALVPNVPGGLRLVEGIERDAIEAEVRERLGVTR